MKKKQNKQGNDTPGELQPLNKKLYNEFTIKELEERLETDPLLLGAFLAGDNARGCQCRKECDQCTCNDGATICAPHCPNNEGLCTAY